VSTHLSINQSIVIPVDSRSRYNPGITVDAGETYRFTMSADTWKDGKTSEEDCRYYECTAAGWPSDLELSWAERLAMRVLELKVVRSLAKVRVSDAEYFELCGCYDENDETAFRIGSHPSPHIWKATRDGTLSFFANDASADRFYENNEGVIHFSVDRLT